MQGVTSPRILVTGVAAMDFVFFVDEMPRTAEKYKTGQASIQGGGGGANAAVSVARLGGASVFVGRAGSDPVGDMIAADLVAEGVDISLLKRFDAAGSCFASIYVDSHGERQIMSYRDPELPTATDWLGAAAGISFDAVLADTRWPDGALVLLELARDCGKPGVIDVEAPVAAAIPALLAASHAAFSTQGLKDWAGHDDLERGLKEFSAKSGKFACVTRGEEGVIWRRGDQSGHVPAFPVKAIDTLGAGDVWHGAFTLMLGDGMAEVEAMRFANAAAALKCSRLGGRAACPSRAEVEAFLHNQAQVV